VNDAVWAPAATAALVGTVATEALLVDSATVVPLPAPAERLTVPCEVEPAEIVEGFSDTLLTVVVVLVGVGAGLFELLH
jgi:hypothetical protein